MISVVTVEEVREALEQLWRQVEMLNYIYGRPTSANRLLPNIAENPGASFSVILRSRLTKTG